MVPVWIYKPYKVLLFLFNVFLQTLLVVDIWILCFGVLSAIKVANDDVSGKTFGYPWLLICRFGVGFGAGGTSQA